MKYVITSDIHIGSPHSRVQLFCELLRLLADDVTLILAGDVIDNPAQHLDTAHQKALNALISRARVSPVYWIHGNHDDGYRPPDTDHIHFGTEFSISQRLYITHGDHFDNVMPRNDWFLKCFSILHHLRIKLGAQPVHVAQFAKKFKPLYSFLRRNVARNAVEHGRECHVDAVACGHVHYAEDIVCDGMRYINLGAWTESPCYCLLVDPHSIQLHPVDQAFTQSNWFKPAP